MCFHGREREEARLAWPRSRTREEGKRVVVSSCSMKIGRSASRVLTSGNLPILASCLRKLSKCRELRPRGMYTLDESNVRVIMSRKDGDNFFSLKNG